MREHNERMAAYTFPLPFSEEVITDVVTAARLNALQKIQVIWERVGDEKAIAIWTLTTSPKGARILDPDYLPSPTALRACTHRVIVHWKDKAGALPHMKLEWSPCEVPDVKRVKGLRRFADVSLVPARMGARPVATDVRAEANLACKAA
jgi:hypothetical protein